MLEIPTDNEAALADCSHGDVDGGDGGNWEVGGGDWNAAGAIEGNGMATDCKIDDYADAKECGMMEVILNQPRDSPKRLHPWAFAGKTWDWMERHKVAIWGVIDR